LGQRGFLGGVGDAEFCLKGEKETGGKLETGQHSTGLKTLRRNDQESGHEKSTVGKS